MRGFACANFEKAITNDRDSQFQINEALEKVSGFRKGPNRPKVVARVVARKAEQAGSERWLRG